MVYQSDYLNDEIVELNGKSNIPKIFEFELFTYATSEIASDEVSKCSFVPFLYVYII